METDEAVEKIGFGIYQIRFSVFGSIAAALTGVDAAVLIFLTYSPIHRCVIPGLANDTFHPTDAQHNYIINLTIPEGEDGFCKVYDVQPSLYLTAFNESATDARDAGYEMRECDEWVYDTSLFTNTIVTEYNFVCDGALKIAHSRMVYFFGYLLGGLTFGLLGDILGRKISYMLALIALLASSVSIPWISGPNAYMVLLFFCGCGGTGSYMNMFVILMEFVEKRRRVFVATVVALGWVAGLVYGIALAYFIREWRTLQIVAFYPFLLVLTSYWFIPESVRWLVSRGKYKKAEEILQKAAKINRVKLHDIHLDRVEPNDSEGKPDNIIRVIKSPVLLKRFLILGINWITASMVYYGLTLNSGNLSGDVFLEFLLSSLIEIPMYILILFAVERTGRKSFHITSMCVGGLSCIITIFPVVLNKTGLQALTITLATIGKAAITAAFQMVYIYTPELFPTRLRMSVLGITSCCARIGGMAAPYVVELGKLIGGDYSTVIPLLIFGGLSLVAGLLCIMLPETKGKELPETLEEAERLISLKEKTDDLYSPDEIPLNTQRLEDGLVASSPLSTTEPIESDNTERNAIPVTTISTEKLENLDLPDSHIRVEQLAVCTDSKVLFQEAKVDQPDQKEDTEIQVQNISPDEDVLDCSKSRECVKETLPENFHKGGTNVDPRDKSDLQSIETDSTNTPKSGTQDVTTTDPSQTENILKQGNDDNAGENVSPEDGSDIRRYESDKDSTDKTHMDKSESAPIQNVDKVIDGKVVPTNIRNYEVEIQL